MGKIVKVRSRAYTFYLDGRRIFIKLDGVISQQFTIKTFDNAELTDEDYVNLIDAIYRKRIVDTQTLNNRLFSKYRLVTTNRILK